MLNDQGDQCLVSSKLACLKSRDHIPRPGPRANSDHEWGVCRTSSCIISLALQKPIHNGIEYSHATRRKMVEPLSFQP